MLYCICRGTDCHTPMFHTSIYPCCHIFVLHVLIPLTGPERQSFSHLLKSLTNCLPDDDTQYSVFDYYVDESGEWDVWQTRLPVGGGESGTGAVDLLGNVYVDTTDSVSNGVPIREVSSFQRVVCTGTSLGHNSIEACTYHPLK